MSKGSRLLITFAVLVVIIGVYLLVYFDVFKKEDEQTQPKYESTVERLTDVDESNVERILVDVQDRKIAFIPAQEEGTFTIDMDYPVELNLKEVGYAVDTLLNLFASRVIDKNPKDPSIYGFDNPILRVRILEKDGNVIMFTAGSSTPDKGSYYVQVHPQPAVYVVSDYYLKDAFKTINDYRPRDIPPINLQEFTYLKVVNDEVLECVPMTEADRNDRGANYAAFKVVKPYTSPKEMDGQFIENYYPDFTLNARIIDFIDDNPADLNAYGLGDKAWEIHILDKENEFHVLLGDEHDADTVYARYPGRSTVFTLRKSDVAIREATAYMAVSKNIMLVNIEKVDNFSVSLRDGRRFDAAITRKPDPEDPEKTLDTYMLNGIPIDEDPFKKYYQKAIGLSAHAINPTPAMRSDDPYLHITYYLNSKEGATAEISVLEYDRNFYAIYAFGEATFLTAREEIEQLILSAEALLYGE